MKSVKADKALERIHKENRFNTKALLSLVGQHLKGNVNQYLYICQVADENYRGTLPYRNLNGKIGYGYGLKIGWTYRSQGPVRRIVEHARTMKSKVRLIALLKGATYEDEAMMKKLMNEELNIALSDMIVPTHRGGGDLNNYAGEWFRYDHEIVYKALAAMYMAKQNAENMISSNTRQGTCPLQMVAATFPSRIDLDGLWFSRELLKKQPERTYRHTPVFAPNVKTIPRSLGNYRVGTYTGWLTEYGWVYGSTVFLGERKTRKFTYYQFLCFWNSTGESNDDFKVFEKRKSDFLQTWRWVESMVVSDSTVIVPKTIHLAASGNNTCSAGPKTTKKSKRRRLNFSSLYRLVSNN